MLGWVCSYIARRRRFFLVKVSVVAFFLMTFMIWTQVQKPSWPTKNNEDVGPKLDYQKADSGLRKPFLEQNEISTGDAVERGRERLNKHRNPNEVEELPSDIKFLRKKVLKENRDEFLTPILNEFSFSEVDLAAKGIPSFTDYDEEIKDDLTRVKPGLGDGGVKATVPSYQQNVADEIMKKEAFNRLLSEMISPNRSTPDTREATCRSEVYDQDLPDMSVVIIFTNEAFTSLVRTLHSVVNRTPKKLLREIIIVDDFSDHRDLKGKLERYIATHFKVGSIRLVRLNRRAGLIRARMIGAHLAIGDVLLFLDAHCEAIVGWAEPLLQRIKEDRRAVVCPIIDVIDDKTMEYYHGNGEFFQIGGFTWSGHFTWINIPPYEAKRKKKHNSPTRSPTMAGGLFAIERKYFWEIGSYDSDMQLWGGENLEMSFRVWQCGGSVEIIPCSRVGHIFRNFHPYTFPNNVDSHGLNTARLAEVWMDEFKELFYSHRKELKVADYGSVSKRVEFRKKMQCKSFKWFLDNIYKEKFQMHFDCKAYGQIKNTESNQCLDNLQHSESEEYTLSVYPCHTVLYPSQTFMLSNKGELRREAECAQVESNDKVQMVQCEHVRANELWDLKNDKISSRKTGKCLTLEKDGSNYLVKVKDCVDSPYQKWTIEELKLDTDL